MKAPLPTYEQFAAKLSELLARDPSHDVMARELKRLFCPPDVVPAHFIATESFIIERETVPAGALVGTGSVMANNDRIVHSFEPAAEFPHVDAGHVDARLTSGAIEAVLV
jgi:hypothetical protein